jgi:predicted TIM-barrel fold metal-dependent hydrolase
MRKGESAMHYTGPIFDGDQHIYEAPDAWSRYLPEKYRKDWSYTWKRADDGEWALHVGNRKVDISGGYFTEDGRVPPPGRLHEWLRAMKEGKDNVDMRVPMSPDMLDRDARLRKLDEFGVDGCLMFIGHMVATFSYLDQPESAAAVIHAYNRFLAEDWGFAYKDRLFATPILSLADPEAAVREAEWVVRNGARVVVMPMGPVNRRHAADPYYDGFWSILNEAKVQVSFHLSDALWMHDYIREWGETPLTSRQRQTAWQWVNAYGERPVMETVSSYIMMNFFARYPNIKMISVENGAEWVPGLLVKMDKSRGMAKNGYWPCGQLKERPSHIFQKHFYVVAYPEDDLRKIIDLVGSDDWIVMGSDYPHAEGVAEPRVFIEEACRGLSARSVEKIMHENGWNFVRGLANPGPRATPAMTAAG